MTDDLVTFLRARLTEQRALATRIKERFTARGEYAVEPGKPYWPTARVAKAMRDYDDPDVAAQGDLIEMFGPDQVIALVDADLRIIDLHKPEPGQHPDFCGHDLRELPCPTLRLLALREEWRP